MSWWSSRSRRSDRAASDPTADTDVADPHASDRTATSERRQEIVRALQTHLATVHSSTRTPADETRFDPNLDLYEAGYLDSLNVSAFLLLTEQRYGISLPDWLIGAQANSLAALAAYIEAALIRQAP